MEALVSIIVPVYNCEKYIKRCIDSILEQSYKNIELVLVDDGSIDDSGNICLNAVNMISNGRYYYQENRGVSSARNLGLENANGKYVTFIDADDYVDPDYIQKMVALIEKENADMVISNANDVFENNKIVPSKRCTNDILLDKEQAIESFLKSTYFACVCWGRLYRSELIKDIRFDTEMRVAEDGKFFWKVLENCSKVFVTSDRYYYYFVHGESTVHSGFSSKFYDEVRFCKELCERYRDESYFKDLAYRKLFFYLGKLLSFPDIDKTDFLRLRDEYIVAYKNVSTIIPLKSKSKFYILRNYILRKCYLRIKSKG